MMNYGSNVTPWDLRPLLYLGGAGAKANKVAAMISSGILSDPILNRLPLVEKLHDTITGDLVSGGSRHTTEASIFKLRQFFTWVDDERLILTLNSAESVYIAWTDHLLHRQRVVKNLSANSILVMATYVSRLLSESLELRVGLISKTRIRKQSRKLSALSTKAEKQSLEQTFEFGHFLLDITDSLSVEAIRGKLPVEIRFRSGQLLKDWSGRKQTEALKSLTDEKTPLCRRKEILEARAAWEADTSLRTRFPLVNLRILAEMLIFIAQTGMNRSQAHSLKISKFRYQSHLDGYQVHRVYKSRRQGEVAFSIYSEYREIFERYLVWRNTIFQADDNDLLFPLVRPGGRATDVPPSYDAVKKRCKMIGITFFSPSTLRKTRVNWMLRRSRDLEMTAEMHSHTQETLIQYYQQPNLQVTMVEISRFHASTDPAIAPPGPGVCVKAEPRPMQDNPPEAATPDCVSPTGCLFCEHQRDIDSEDHVWSLTSLRHLKSLELARYRPSTNGNTPHAAEAAINQITNKLKHFSESSEVRLAWVREAIARIEEDDIHPRWGGFVRLMETLS